MADHYRITEPLHEVFGKWTHREFLTRYHWIESQLNKPNRSDYYLMQIAMAVIATASDGKSRAKLDDYKIRFYKTDGRPDIKDAPPQTIYHPPETIEEATRQSKKLWLARLGIRPQKRKKEKP